ncbi:eukaryotic translation initiation factor 5B, partial [Cryomyces antarcticus]
AQKKLRDKQKIDELKKSGQYKTKAQKEAEANAKRRLQQMLDSGAQVAAFNEPTDKKKSRDDNRKRKGIKKVEEPKRDDEEEARQKLEELRLAQEQEEKAKAAAEAARLDAESKKAE